MTDYIINYCKYNSNIIPIIIEYFENLLSNKNFNKFNIKLDTRYDNNKLIFEDLTILKSKLEQIILLSFISNNDDELLTIIDRDIYNLLKFILSTPKVDILNNNKINMTNIKEYDIKFYNNNRLQGNSFKYLFHGSSSTNWYSILTNGLINCSNTNLMLNGSAYGSGIYLSNNIELSQSYSQKYYSKHHDNNNITIGVFKISSDDYDKYKKTVNIFVVPDYSKLEFVSIIVYKNTLKSDEVSYINNYYDKTIHENELSNKILLINISAKRLNNEYNLLSKKYNVKWISKNTSLSDMLKDNIIWEIEIKDLTLLIKFYDYPINPPFIFIKNKILVQTDNNNNISDNGAFVCNLMSQTYWLSSMKINNIIDEINTIINKYLYIKLEDENKLEDAISDYKKISSKYYWRVYHL